MSDLNFRDATLFKSIQNLELQEGSPSMRKILDYTFNNYRDIFIFNRTGLLGTGEYENPPKSPLVYLSLQVLLENTLVQATGIGNGVNRTYKTGDISSDARKRIQDIINTTSESDTSEMGGGLEIIK